jgi:hypothetical protein
MYEILPVDILSPRAFVASIVSAQMLSTRILSPAAFRAEVVAFTGLEAMILRYLFGWLVFFI